MMILNTRGRAPLLVLSAVALMMSAMGVASAHGTQAVERQPTVDRAAAEKAALLEVPNGAIEASKLEKRHGELVWSFDITKPESKNVTKVRIDANNGHILSAGMQAGRRHITRHQHHSVKST